MNKIGQNKPCSCGSGKKFKRCCGPRGGLTKIQYAEVQAYREKEERERPRSKGGFMLPFAFAPDFMSGPGPAPPPPRKRGRRKPR